MRAQPGTEQGPKAFDRVDVYFGHTVAIVVASVFALAVIHGDMLESPMGQLAVDVVFVGVQLGSWLNELADERLDRDLLNILQHPQQNLARTLNHSQNRRLLLFQGAASASTFQPSSSATSPCFFTASGCS